jgi:hypothetical protein
MTKEEYRRQRAWAKVAEKIVMSRVYGPGQFNVASDYHDRMLATDYILPFGKRVAVRCRKFAVSKKHMDFTIRAKNSLANKTEISKLANVDEYVYGWFTNGYHLLEYICMDIQAMVKSGIFKSRWKFTKNRDGRTGFIAIPLKEITRVGAANAIGWYPRLGAAIANAQGK